MVKPSGGMVVEKESNFLTSYKVGKGWLTAGTEGGGCGLTVGMGLRHYF